MPAIIGLGGTLYTVAAVVLGSLFVVFAFACYREREGRGGRPRRQEPVRLFRALPVPAVRGAPRRAGLRHRRQRVAAALDVVMQDAEKERQRRQRMRSLAIAWILAGARRAVLHRHHRQARRPMSPIRPSEMSRHERQDTDHRKQQRRHGSWRCRLSASSPAWSASSFASVPLYRMFCQVTGYGGTPQRAEQGADEVLDRTIRIRFDANVDRALPWTLRAGAADSST